MNTMENSPSGVVSKWEALNNVGTNFFQWVSFFIHSNLDLELPLGSTRHASLWNHKFVWVLSSIAIGCFLEKKFPSFHFSYTLFHIMKIFDLEWNTYASSMKRITIFRLFSHCKLRVRCCCSFVHTRAVYIFSIAMMMQALYQSSFSVWLGE